MVASTAFRSLSIISSSHIPIGLLAVDTISSLVTNLYPSSVCTALKTMENSPSIFKFWSNILPIVFTLTLCISESSSVCIVMYTMISLGSFVLIKSNISKKFFAISVNLLYPVSFALLNISNESRYPASSITYALLFGLASALAMSA